MLFVDADIVAYKASYAAQNKEIDDAIDIVDYLMDVILEDNLFDPGDPFSFEVYLTGQGNFRYDIAVTAPYKGQRKGEKPLFLYDVREHLVEHWMAQVVHGEEADDRIAIRVTDEGPHSIIASVDKDFLQIPCTHYNINKQTWQKVEPHEAMMNFYTQMLTGDKVDNIIGLYGIGPKKAEKMLAGLETEADMYQVVLDAYDGDVERVIENGRLLWLRREEDQLWSPPEV